MHCVITTIQRPTNHVRQLVAALAASSSQLVIVGDRKGPDGYDLGSVKGWSEERLAFLNIEKQLAGEFTLAAKLPTDHYGRKNIGYLSAMVAGAAIIYETDDDNAPLPTWSPRDELVPARSVAPQGWCNAYRYFSDELVWPRGYPLDELHTLQPELSVQSTAEVRRAPIQQGLANGSPDVDAIWRLVSDRPFEFTGGDSVWLAPGCWCPFNSQSTWWWPEAYPLMYLPSHCSFRVTDIWRSFIAQRCLWEMGYGVVFHPPEVFQQRNRHDLMKDFAEEVCGYLRNKELAGVLAGLDLQGGQGATGANLYTCYEALVAHDFFPRVELDLVQAWLWDLAALGALESN